MGGYCNESFLIYWEGAIQIQKAAILTVMGGGTIWIIKLIKINILYSL